MYRSFFVVNLVNIFKIDKDGLSFNIRNQDDKYVLLFLQYYNHLKINHKKCF